jgi:hypothetical protein
MIGKHMGSEQVPAPKGFTRALYQHLQHWLRERRARPPPRASCIRRGVGVPLRFRAPAMRRPGGKNWPPNPSLDIHARDRPSKRPRHF